MAQYRTQCPGVNCDCIGPMEGAASGGYSKKHFVEVNRKRHGGESNNEQLLLRCPKCKHRWRARTSTVHAW